MIGGLYPGSSYPGGIGLPIVVSGGTFTDSATISTGTSVSSTDIVADTESAQISTTTSVSYIELGPSTIDAGTVPGSTTVSGVDALFHGFAETATITTRTSIIVVDDITLHPSGFWGPYDTDNGII